MIVHSLRIITQYKRYVNLPFDLSDHLHKKLGLTLTAVWEFLYKESDWNDGLLTRTHAYMARKLLISRRTLIRYLERLIDLGFLKKTHNYAEDGRYMENTYEIDLPPDIMYALNTAPDRKRSEIELIPDYSIPHESIPEEPSPSKIPEAKGTPRQINEMVTNCNQLPGGAMGKMLNRIKDGIKERGGMCQDLHNSYNRLNQDINNTKTESVTDCNQFIGDEFDHSQFANSEQRQETEPKTAITCSARGKENQNPVKSLSKETELSPKTVSQAVVNKIGKIVKGIPGVSNPSNLIQEAIHFVSTRKEGYSEWASVGAFRKLLGKDGCGVWRTPFSMRYKK